MKKLLAFTLAETLIVIGIIGVVSALTLPNLNSSTGEKEKVAKVKKIYQNLDDAIGRAVTVYGPVDEWFANDTTNAAQSTRFANRVTEFMKVSKDCGANTGCWSTKPYYFIDGGECASNYYQSLTVKNARFVVLADGTALAKTAYVTYGRAYVSFKVDIDGPNKGQNKDGVDIFHFFYSDNTLIPDYGFGYHSDKFAVNSNYSQNMTAWVILNGNLDYLKCINDLNWDNKTSCK